MPVINKSEVIRYLGGRGQKTDEGISADIDRLIAECEKIAVPRYVYKQFDIDDAFKIKNSDFTFLGEDIKKHLCGAKKVVVMAATIGFEIEKRTELYKHRCLKDSVIFDACATAYIESVCDETEDEIRRQKKEEGLFLTTRFSPGYGDFPITLQKDIISLTGADKRIGLTVTKSNILLPRKSVTAVMGITENSLADKTGRCSCCSMANGCEFKKNGKQCIL